MVYVLLLLACGATDPVQPFVGDVDVYGFVTGWDGTGDVAVEACGVGTLIGTDGGFAARMNSTCEIRVVWEKVDQRARGPWRGLGATGPEVRIVLEMPEPHHLQRLSPEALREKEGYIRSAQRQLIGDEETESASEASRDY